MKVINILKEWSFTLCEKKREELVVTNSRCHKGTVLLKLKDLEIEVDAEELHRAIENVQNY